MTLFAKFRAALRPVAAAAVVFAAAAASLAGAWTFQVLGFQPCELCLIKR
jgi:disulfide bond formation protein DsbB